MQLPSIWALEKLAPHLPLPLRIACSGERLSAGPLKLLMSRLEATNALIRTTMAATLVRAGTRENVLPQEAAAVVNCRLLPGDSIDYVISRTRAIVKDPRVRIEVRGPSNEASPVSRVDSHGYGVLETTVAELFPGAATIPILLPGMSDARHYASVSRDIFRFAPMRAGRDDRARVHGTDERIGVENYGEFIAFYERIIRNAQGYASPPPGS